MLKDKRLQQLLFVSLFTLICMGSWGHQANAARCTKSLVKTKERKVGACRIYTYTYKGSTKVISERLVCAGWQFDLRKRTFKKGWCKAFNRPDHFIEDSIAMTWRWRDYHQLTWVHTDFNGGMRAVTQTSPLFVHRKTGKVTPLGQVFGKYYRQALQEAKRIIKRHNRNNVGACAMSRRAPLFARVGRQPTLYFASRPTTRKAVCPGRIKVAIHTGRLIAISKREQGQIEEDTKLGKRGSLGKIQAKHSFWVDRRSALGHYFVSFLYKEKGHTKARFAWINATPARPTEPQHSVVLRMPAFRGNQWSVKKINAVGWADVDRDGHKDIIVLASCFKAAGPKANKPFGCTSTYFRRGKRYTFNKKWDALMAQKAPTTFGAVLRLAKKARQLFRNPPTKR